MRLHLPQKTGTIMLLARLGVDMFLMIDNYDSFTYNIVQYFGELGCPLTVVRNDKIGLDEVLEMAPLGIILGPGPCTPTQAGITLPILEHFKTARHCVPILGVCLGHQAIGQAFGGRVVRAKRVMHGRISPIRHKGTDLFTGLPDGLLATRYHSLVIDQSTLPKVLEVNAWSANPDGTLEEIMGVSHTHLPIYGVQFHPESILSEEGHALFANFLRLAGRPLKAAEQGA